VACAVKQSHSYANQQAQYQSYQSPLKSLRPDLQLLQDISSFSGNRLSMKMVICSDMDVLTYSQINAAEPFRVIDVISK